VATFGVPRRSGEAEICYILINDLPSLVWSANTANLEIHPFLSRVPEIDRPTSVVFDLDPGEGTDILACGETAFLLREKLTAMGVESCVKVSGSKGLQLYVPLNSRVTYAETQPFAKTLAETLAREHPDRIVAVMAKANRDGKVFIDWSQNSDFKTTVCAYSMRAATSNSSPPDHSWHRGLARNRTACSKRFQGAPPFRAELLLLHVERRCRRAWRTRHTRRPEREMPASRCPDRA
jgi:bifunctional non-homologous end joining protein LigD